MKRVAMYISSLQKGGSERVMVNLAEYLNEKGIEVIFVTPYKREVEYEIHPNIKRVFSEPDESQLQGGRVHNFISRYKKLRSIWKEYKPDVILSFLGKNNINAIITNAFLPAKVAVSVRGEPTMEYETSFIQKVAKFTFRFADGVIFQTKQQSEFFPTAVRRKSIILPNPLNLQFVTAQTQAGEEDKIVTVGRMDDNKNQAMLINAFAKIADAYPKTELIIYGDGPSRAQLEALVEQKHMQARISMPGSITDVAQRISKAKIFALTSNTEGMPNSIMEAMSLGLAVVSTDCPCGGPAELIQHGENGMLVPVGDEDALAEAFARILSDAEYASKLGDNARKIVDLLEPKKVNRQWEEFLSNL